MSLQQFCQRRVISISPESNVVEACHLLGRNNIGCMVVQEGGKLCGVLTDRDIALKVTGDGKDPQKTKVRDIMTRDPVRIPVNKDLRELTALMHTHHVRRVPVVDGVDEVLGIVTMDDLIALISDEMSDLGKTIAETVRMGTA